MTDEQKGWNPEIENLRLKRETIANLAESERERPQRGLRPSDTCMSFATGTEPMTCFCP
jgi:hypothetical protein